MTWYEFVLANQLFSIGGDIESVFWLIIIKVVVIVDKDKPNFKFLSRTKFSI